MPAPPPTDEAVQPIDTQGGTFIAGNVTTDGGDFVARDQIVYGDKVLGHKIEGDALIVQITPQIQPEPIPATAPPPAHFTGRRELIEEVKQTLTQHHSASIIALQGMGGIGKTAIVLQVAAEAKPMFPGGIFWAALPNHNGNPRPILQLWANLCHQDLSAHTDPEVMSNLVRGYLTFRVKQQGPLLAIMDDVRLEWLAAAKAIKQAIPAGTSLLLTTRDASLASVLDADTYPIGPMSADDALALLKAHIGAPPVESQLAEAITLIRTVDYLPLAIELAAKQWARMSRRPGYNVATLRTQVEVNATKVLSIAGTASLAATFAVTYDHLSNDLQRIFRWLGSFASGPLQLKHIAGLLERDEDTLRLILDDEFVQLALVSWGMEFDSYTIHAMLRQYAQSLLTETGEAEAASRRHLAYYLALAQANANQEPQDWDVLEAALPNFLLAIESAIRFMDSNALLRFEEALLHDSLFLNVRGYYREAVHLLSQSLDVQRRHNQRQYQARTQNKLAWFAYLLGELEQAQQQAQAAYHLAVELSDKEQQADGLRYQGVIALVQGETKGALGYFERELAIRHELADPSRLATCFGHLAMVEMDKGNYTKAAHYLDAELQIHQEENDQNGIVSSLSSLGNMAFYLGNYDSALDHFQRALALGEALGNRNVVAHNLFNVGMIECYRNHYTPALRNLNQALAVYQKIGSTEDELSVLTKLAELYSYLGDLAQALTLLEKVRMQIESIDDVTQKLEYLNVLGMLRYEQGEYANALTVQQNLIDFATKHELTYLLVQGMLGGARTLLTSQSVEAWENGARYATMAIDLCQQLALAGDEPRGHAYLGQAHLYLGDREQAMQNCRASVRLLEKQESIRGSAIELYLISYEVVCDDRSSHESKLYLQKAYDHLMNSAAALEDEDMRQCYLETPLHRKISELWNQHVQ